MTDDRRTSVHPRFSTELVRQLGEEIIPTLDKGVLELLKNSSDADATGCLMELRDTDWKGGGILVRVNDDGMIAVRITDGWIAPA